MDDYIQYTHSETDVLCICGRDATRIHCPHCGSATVRGLASRQDRVTREDGHVDTLAVFRCRKCSAVFNDDDWRLRCTAPSPRIGRPPLKPDKTVFYDDTVPKFDSETALEALEKLKKMKGW